MTPARPRWQRAALAFAALAVATVGMLLFHDRLDKAHVALVYLLVVLGGSAAEGRRVGFGLAVTAFVAFNIFFLPPYYTLTIADPLDWIVLVAFLATSLVAAELLARLRRHAELAEQRTLELDRLSTLGAETLNAARAEQALTAIAAVIRSAVGVDRCALFIREGARVRALGDRGDDDPSRALIDPDSLLGYVVQSGQAAIERDDATLRLVPVQSADGRFAELRHVRAFALPLAIRGETVGALRVSAAAGFTLTEDRRRLLLALAYYAALGIERLRLEQSEETTAALRRADRLKDALLASVSHDLRTPLTTIKAIAHEIAHGANPARAAVIEEEADRLSNLVDDLLHLSQLDADALPMSIEVNTVDDLIGAALRRAESTLQNHPVWVELADDEMLVGRFDLSHAIRILVNLLENAAKYSAPNAPVSIVARRSGDAIEVAVIDRGVGVDVAERERIFQPFYRVPGAAPDVRGAGLGLAIARRLAQAQGGDLTVASGPDGGSCFTLRLAAVDP